MVHVKYILAFCAGSQSLSQLESNYRVFTLQLLSKVITESWLPSATTLCPFQLVNK